MAIGISDLKRVLQMPGAWDLAYLARFNGKEGARVNFDALAREVGAAFGAFNGSLQTGYLSRFVTITDELTSSYSSGTGSQRLPKISEHGKADPLTGDVSGHMLPMFDYGGALAWGYWALRRSPMSKFEGDLRKLVDTGRNTWEYEILNRMFSIAAVKVGNTGKSLPFVDGGVADPDYVPPSFEGNVFTTADNHFTRKTADAAGRIAYLAAAGSELRKHGLYGGYELIVSDAQKANWKALNDGAAKWIRPDRSTTIVVDGVETRVRLDEEVYEGAIETPEAVFFLKPMARVGGDYAHASKAFGFNSPNNPIAVRKEDGYELGLTLVAEIKHYPFEEAQAVFTFGAGVGSRFNGYNGKFAANGEYTDAPIS